MSSQAKLMCDLRHMLAVRRMHYEYGYRYDVPDTGARHFLNMAVLCINYLWYEHGMETGDSSRAVIVFPVFYSDRIVRMCEFWCPLNIAQQVDRDLELRGIRSVTRVGTT